ncbi:transposase [Pseudomonas sp. 5Ae-yellow]|nr:transposase [Pseudomonas sp. 5Ae-yellow]
MNGKLRNACLNRPWFRTMGDARAVIDLWWGYCNHNRPHS